MIKLFVHIQFVFIKYESPYVKSPISHVSYMGFLINIQQLEKVIFKIP